VVVAVAAVAEAMQPIPAAQVMLAQMQTQQLLTLFLLPRVVTLLLCPLEGKLLFHGMHNEST
jgi:hypothetical protein